jgi:hypothetical protein
LGKIKIHKEIAHPTMVRLSFLFLVIALIATLEMFSSPVVSVMPGWHTTIYPPFFWLSILLLGWLYVLSGVYLFLEKKGKPISKIWVMVHLLTTLSFFLYTNGYGLIQEYSETSHIVPYSLIFFGLGQIIFIGFVFSALRRN